MNDFSAEHLCKIFGQQKANEAQLMGIDLIEFSVPNDTLIELFSTKNTTQFPREPDNTMNEYLKKICHSVAINRSIFETFQIKVILLKYVYPLLLVTGLVFNLIMILLIIRARKQYSHRHKDFFTSYLAILSISDIFLLIFSCLREYLEDFYMIKIRTDNIIMCRLFFFMGYLFNSFSAYIHVCLAIERWQNMKFKLKPITTSRSVADKIAVLLVLFICVVFSFTLSLLAKISDNLIMSRNSVIGVDIVKECEINNSLYIDIISIRLIPFLLTFMFILFAFIDKKFIKRNRSLTKKSHELRSSHEKTDYFLNKSKSNFNMENIDILMQQENSNLNNTSDNHNNNNNAQLNRKHLETIQKNSTMLLWILISYEIMILPKLIVFVMGNLFIYIETENLSIAYSLARSITYSNTCINLVIYLILGESVKFDL